MEKYKHIYTKFQPYNPEYHFNRIIKSYTNDIKFQKLLKQIVNYEINILSKKYNIILSKEIRKSLTIIIEENIKNQNMITKYNSLPTQNHLQQYNNACENILTKNEKQQFNNISNSINIKKQICEFILNDYYNQSNHGYISCGPPAKYDILIIKKKLQEFKKIKQINITEAIIIENEIDKTIKQMREKFGMRLAESGVYNKYYK
tara:strand:- start:347 stop:958 length:612 start_codon:yes stop_codon:yes gene_type:complete